MVYVCVCTLALSELTYHGMEQTEKQTKPQQRGSQRTMVFCVVMVKGSEYGTKCALGGG